MGQREFRELQGFLRRFLVGDFPLQFVSPFLDPLLKLRLVTLQGLLECGALGQKVVDLAADQCEFVLAAGRDRFGQVAGRANVQKLTLQVRKRMHDQPAHQEKDHDDDGQ